jgi:hypothetical protein
MATFNVKFIRGYSKWFKLPVETLVNVVIDSDVSNVTRRFICETRLKGIVEYSDIRTSLRRREWAKNNPKWVNLEHYRRMRRLEMEAQAEAQAKELDEKLEPEIDCFEMECDCD